MNLLAPFHFDSRNPPSLVNSWWFLIPFGLICVGMLLARAFGVVQ